MTLTVIGFNAVEIISLLSVLFFSFSFRQFYLSRKNDNKSVRYCPYQANKQQYGMLFRIPSEATSLFPIYTAYFMVVECKLQPECWNLSVGIEILLCFKMF